MSFEHSLREFLVRTLAAPQFFRLTIDLKKLKFVPPICELVVEDRNYADSISLSYLTSPVFQSNDVFHAVNARLNTRDPSELLITDGFCSFRFEDQLLWRDFVNLFVSTPGKSDSGGAVLPIYVRARQDAEKCSTLGVATLKFSSFLAPEKVPTLKDMPQLFFTTCLEPGEPATAASRQVDLPIFELLLKLPLLTKETAAMAGVLTVGIAIDIMHVTLQSKLFAQDRRDDAPCWSQQNAPTGRVERLPQVVSAPTSGRQLDDDLTLVERCYTDTAGHQPNRAALDLSKYRRTAADQSNFLDGISRQVSSDSAPTAMAFRGLAGDGDSSHGTAAGKDHLLQCEMMLLKLNAEQAHQKFREEVKMIEAKSEERIETIRKENQKLRNENRQLEKKLIDFEQKLQMLQDTIIKPQICTHSCNSSDPSSLRKENERLQLLLRAERQKTTNSSTLAESDSVPHAHSVHPVYHQPNERRTIAPSSYRSRTPIARPAGSQPSSSSSSNTDSSPLSSRSKQLLAFHLKRAP